MARKLLGSDRVGCTNPIPLQMQLLRRVGRVSELHRLPRIPPDEWKLEKHASEHEADNHAKSQTRRLRTWPPRRALDSRVSLRP